MKQIILALVFAFATFSISIAQTPKAVRKPYPVICVDIQTLSEHLIKKHNLKIIALKAFPNGFLIFFGGPNNHISVATIENSKNEACVLVSIDGVQSDYINFKKLENTLEAKK